MTEQTIINSIEHFERTGEIQDVIVPFFRQDGKWVGDRRNWSNSTYKMASSILHRSVLPEGRRTAVNAQGDPILLTSFHWKKRRDVEIPWFEVRGSIRIRSLEAFSAKYRRTVGGYIYSCADKHVIFPNLLHVGGDFEHRGTHKIHVPNLTEVGGSLLVSKCDLPNLKIVGKRFSGYWTGTLNLPNLRLVGGSMEIKKAAIVIAPELQWVFQDLYLSDNTAVFCANKLVEVGGSIEAGSVIIFRAASLAHVYDTIDTGSAMDFYRPHFEDSVDWNMHPDAKRRWQIREAVRQQMRDLPQIFI